MTLKDVAEHAGVAPDTARRALQGAPSVRPYIRERVLRSAGELDYHPSLLGRALKEKTLRVVPITVFHLEQIYFGSLAGALSRCLVEAGMEPALCFDPEHLLRMSHSLSTSASILVAGFDARVIRALAQRQKVVTIEAGLKPMANVGSIEVNFPAVYRQVVLAVLATGRRRIAICSSHHLTNVAHGWPNPKFDAVLATLREAGVAPVVPPQQSAFATPAEFGVWLDHHAGAVDAVVCQNDMEGAQMVGVLATRGLRTPEDLLVIGCDYNLPMPGMWSIAVDTTSLARQAVDMLQVLLSGETHVAPQLVTARLVNANGEEIATPPATTRRSVRNQQKTAART